MKIAVLVSGGVDSSVALALLKEQGHDLTAFYLKIWLEDELSYLGDCPWQEDLSYVEAVCKQLNVPLHVVSLQKEYWDTVVAYTIAEIKAGRTPNPDMLCNQRIKFGVFYDQFGKDFDKVATGHYAQVFESEGIFYLHKSPDVVKDQTYFLATLRQDQLAKALFPIGHLQKAQVRTLAESFNIPNKNRKDSQGICFLGKLKFSDFIRHHLGDKTGNLVEFETGIKIGEHPGFWYYTIGQRQGLGLAGGPWYVVKKDHLTNTVYISKSYYDEHKSRDTFYVDHLHLVLGAPGSNITVKLRHGAHVHACTVNTDEQGRTLVQLMADDQGIAPGQFAVFYEQDMCLGAGVIASQAKAKPCSAK